MGINDAAAQSLIRVSPRQRSGSLNDVLPVIVLTLDANGRPAQGNSIQFIAGSTDTGTHLDTTETGSFNQTIISVTTDASGQATVYMKLTAEEDDDEHRVTARFFPASGGFFFRNFSVLTAGTVASNSAPVFSDDTTTRSIAENSAANTDIGSAVTATDADNDGRVYSLTGTDASSFRIIATTGQLQTVAALDYETKNSYEVTVTAYDNEGGSDSITVTINVTDVTETDGPPVFAEGDTATRSVQENQPAGTNVGSPLTATDPDNNQLFYRVDDPDPAAPDNPARATLSTIFSIDNNGQLTTKKALDYETKNSYTAFVSVSDNDDGSDRITVTINVTDVAESGNPPVFAEGTSASRSISRSESQIDRRNIGDPISATDPDGGTLTYSMSGLDSQLLSIVSSTGQLRVSYIPPTRDTLNLTVTATDPTNLTASISVTISINESPVFGEGTSTTRSVAENTAPGTNIGSAVSATDAENDTITYSLEGTDAASFDIVSTSGQLQTKAALDYETKSSYSVIVKASDTKGGVDRITVTINVTDVNEQPPPPPPPPPTESCPCLLGGDLDDTVCCGKYGIWPQYRCAGLSDGCRW